jgi:hypothetical protein
MTFPRALRTTKRGSSQLGAQFCDELQMRLAVCHRMRPSVNDD